MGHVPELLQVPQSAQLQKPGGHQGTPGRPREVAKGWPRPRGCTARILQSLRPAL